MSEQEKPSPPSVSISAEGDAVVGEFVGRDKNTINITNYNNLPERPPAPADETERRLRLTVHLAVFKRTGVLCYFINATNLSQREIEITHIWFDCEPSIHALEPDRPLPKRLKPDEPWETWIEATRIPVSYEDPYTLARARLSTGAIVKSERNNNVPDQGFIPGGPIEGKTGASSVS